MTSDHTMEGKRLTETGQARLLQARGPEVPAIVGAADELRQSASGRIVRYVVNRNINYTNIYNTGAPSVRFQRARLQMRYAASHIICRSMR